MRPHDDIDNGQLICEIGIAPFKPAEFVIFRIQAKDPRDRDGLTRQQGVPACQP